MVFSFGFQFGNIWIFGVFEEIYTRNYFAFLVYNMNQNFRKMYNLQNKLIFSTFLEYPSSSLYLFNSSSVCSSLL